MLSYQHAYHAGNFADVLKHLVLIQVLTYLKTKDKPLCYIDTHAGVGSYRLHSAEAQKNQEFLDGIGAIWQRDGLPSSLVPYVGLIHAFNPTDELKRYPGSPAIAQQILADNDRLFLYELHKNEYQSLHKQFKNTNNINILREDGLTDSIRLLPPKERRGLILIDPSYEVKTEYQRVIDSLLTMHKRFATGCYLLWYPVVDRRRIQTMEHKLKTSGIGNIQLFELGLQLDDNMGMTACGMIVINPPWILMPEMHQALPWLAKTLGINQQGYSRIVQLTEE